MVTLFEYFMEFRQALNNVVKYFFWSLAILSIGAIFILPILGFGEIMAESYNQWYQVLYGLFPFLIFLGLLKIYQGRLEVRKWTFKKVMRKMMYVALIFNVIFLINSMETITGYFLFGYYIILITLVLFLIDITCDLILTLFKGWVLWKEE
ncbi:hypothetical protein [Bacillus safensis]|uniref:Uncharacterized protein n=1 Tax=Bacillus safensis TaxID=561879 RepID=A0A1L6ZPB3_BACIA|nr:hypothetical protein [Bacillus safensis]APT48349.1 hypothetical protein BSA145_21025 [Bacillus safensis]